MGNEEWYDLLTQLDEHAISFLTDLAEDLLRQQQASSDFQATAVR